MLALSVVLTILLLNEHGLTKTVAAAGEQMTGEGETQTKDDDTEFQDDLDRLLKEADKMAREHFEELDEENPTNSTEKTSDEQLEEVVDEANSPNVIHDIEALFVQEN